MMTICLYLVVLMDIRGRTFFLSPLLPPLSESTYNPTKSSNASPILDPSLVDTMHLLYHREYLSGMHVDNDSNHPVLKEKERREEDEINREISLLTSWQRALQENIQPQAAVLSSLSSPPPLQSSSSFVRPDDQIKASRSAIRSEWQEIRIPTPRIQVCDFMMLYSKYMCDHVICMLFVCYLFI